MGTRLTDDPNGNLIGYVEELNYQVLDYATKEEAQTFAKARSLTELRKLAAARKIRL